MKAPQLYPAIDVRGGRVVRLRQGNYAEETHYFDDPLAVAKAFFKAGATWLHLVDLDAARKGSERENGSTSAWTLASLVGAIKDQTGLKVQSGGGIRSEDDVIHLFASGVNRVVIGSLVTRETDLVCGWIEKYGADRIAVALDVKQKDTLRDARNEHSLTQWQLPTLGWTEQTEVDFDALLARLKRSGVKHILSTDISRDGMLSGLNFDLYQAIQKRIPNAHIQCSGGVRDLDDVRQVRAQRFSGVVLGRALLEGKMTIEAALSC